MRDQPTLDELVTLFRKLGAPDPEGWARSQHDEGIDHLARFLFLRQAWRAVVAPDDRAWIDRAIKQEQRRADPGAGLGPAVQRLLEAGGNPEDIHEVVCVMQFELLFGLCSLLDDPGDVEPEVADVSWRLMRINEWGDPIGTIDALHESVLETDPEGRELRPRVG